MEKKYGYHEVRTMSNDSLRALCISQRWFTSGSNSQYEELLDMTETENVDTDTIVEIASVIAENTPRVDGETMGEQFSRICFQLFRICTTFIAED